MCVNIDSPGVSYSFIVMLPCFDGRKRKMRCRTDV